MSDLTLLQTLAPANAFTAHEGRLDKTDKPNKTEESHQNMRANIGTESPKSLGISYMAMSLRARDDKYAKDSKSEREVVRKRKDRDSKQEY